MKKLLLVLALLLAACGGGDTVDSSADAPTTTAADAEAGNTTTAAPAETQAPTTAAPAPSSGPAAIVLTIGDETWEFGRAFCAYVGATPGQEGSEWNVSNTDADAQVYVADDAFGVLVQYADISNGGNPDFDWEAQNDGLSIAVDGNDITVSGQFTDSVSGTGPLAGTLTATCSGWAEG
ncbi:MAG: hypothetical protein GY720_18075 [bacterium]|nr:hypothetical protein [bacterium]